MISNMDQHTQAGKKVGMVLSGGGARGVAHLGAIKALKEYGIEPGIMAGSSAGAIVAAFHAAGYTPEDMLEIIKHAGLFSPTSLSLHGGGILGMNAFRKLYTRYIAHNSFEKLHIPLYIAATDILLGETIYFSDGELAPAIMASGCVPVIFTHVEYRGHTLYDGGILNNLPVEPLRGRCDLIIGVYVNSIERGIKEVHTIDLVDRSFHMAMYESMHAKLLTCDLAIEPPLMSRYGIFDLHHLDDIFRAGYDYTRSLEPRILAFKEKMETGSNDGITD